MIAHVDRMKPVLVERPEPRAEAEVAREGRDMPL
jgi:hypothetical protein